MENLKVIWRTYKKYIIIAAISFVVIMAGTVFGLMQLNKDDTDANDGQTTNNSSDSQENGEPSGGGGGSALTGNSGAIKGGVSSLRNLKGLLAQVNQIDVCAAPDLTAYITVTAEDSSALTSLQKGDFNVKLDGKEVKDFSFDLVQKKNLPLQTTLVIDHSGSMKGEPMQKAKEAAINYVNHLKATDSVSVIQFDTSVDTLAGLSTDKQAAINAINSIQPRGDTSLYDALATASDQTPDCGRKAIILLSDGEDTASKSFTVQTATQKAATKSVPAFVVGLKSPGFTPSILRNIAENTGAQYFEAPAAKDLDTMYKKVSGQLDNQYVATFKIPVSKTNGLHTLKVTSNVQGSPTTSERSFTY